MHTQQTSRRRKLASLEIVWVACLWRDRRSRATLRLMERVRSVSIDTALRPEVLDRRSEFPIGQQFPKLCRSKTGSEKRKRFAATESASPLVLCFVLYTNLQTEEKSGR
jgi:hypothetical protein